jgi:hypothetical protein
VAAAAPIAAALSQHTGPGFSGSDQPAAKQATPAAAAAAAAAVQPQHTSSSASGSSPWAQLLSALPKLTNLSTLEFAGNGGSYFLTSRPSSAEDFEKGLNKLRISEPALLLLRFAAAADTSVHTVYFTNADHHHHAPHVGSVREHTGELSGHWNDALPAVAAAMLLAIGECQKAGQQASGSSAAATGAGAGAAGCAVFNAVGEEDTPLEQQLGSMQVAAGQCGGSSSSKGGCAVHSNRVFSAAATQRLQALIGKLQAAQQQQQQLPKVQLLRGLDFEEGAQQATESTSGALRPCLSKVEAIEAVQLLLPGLQSLHFPW